MNQLALLIVLKIFACVFFKPLLGLTEDEVETRKNEFLDKAIKSAVDLLPNVLVETLGGNLDQLSQYRQAQVNFNLATAILQTWEERVKVLSRLKNDALEAEQNKSLSITLIEEDRRAQELAFEYERDFLIFLGRKFREATYKANHNLLEEMFVNNLLVQGRNQSDIFAALKDQELAKSIFWNAISTLH